MQRCRRTDSVKYITYQKSLNTLRFWNASGISGVCIYTQKSYKYDLMRSVIFEQESCLLIINNLIILIITIFGEKVARSRGLDLIRKNNLDFYTHDLTTTNYA